MGPTGKRYSSLVFNLFLLCGFLWTGTLHYCKLSTVKCFEDDPEEDEEAEEEEDDIENDETGAGEKKKKKKKPPGKTITVVDDHEMP